MAEAKQFADAIHAKFPGKLLAYNCSPSFNWKLKLSDAEIAEYQKVCLGSCAFAVGLTAGQLSRTCMIPTNSVVYMASVCLSVCSSVCLGI